MRDFFHIKFANINKDKNAGPPDVGAQHAQIAAELQQKEGKKEDYQGLISGLPFAKTLESVAGSLDQLNKSIAPQIDASVNLGKDAGLQTGSLIGSVSVGGIAGGLKIFGEQKTLQCEGYDPSILAAQAPGADSSHGEASNQDGGQGSGENDFSDGGSGAHDNSTYADSGNNPIHGDGGSSQYQGNSGSGGYELPDLSGISSSAGGGVSSQTHFQDNFNTPSKSHGSQHEK